MVSENSTRPAVVSRASRRYHSTPAGACGDAWYTKQLPMLRALQAHVDTLSGGDGDSGGGAKLHKPFAVAWGFKDRPGYMYGFYSDIDAFYSNLLRVPAGERRGCELILADAACKNYADLEWVGPRDVRHEKLQEIAKRLRAFSQAAYKCSAGFYVCCSTRRKELKELKELKDSKWKNSYHIVFDNLVFDNNHGGAMKDFWERFVESELSGDEWHWDNGGKQAHVIDMSVYSRNRPMRLPLCCKAGGVPFVRISGDPFDENDDFTAEFAEDDPAAWRCFAISNPAPDNCNNNTTKVSNNASSRSRMQGEDILPRLAS